MSGKLKNIDGFVIFMHVDNGGGFYYTDDSRVFSTNLHDAAEYRTKEAAVAEFRKIESTVSDSKPEGVNGYASIIRVVVNQITTFDLNG